MIKMLCHVCGKPTTRACKLCGRPTCDDHLGKHGLCPSCESQGRKF